jgi:hypothetical protein
MDGMLANATLAKKEREIKLLKLVHRTGHLARNPYSNYYPLLNS